MQEVDVGYRLNESYREVQEVDVGYWLNESYREVAVKLILDGNVSNEAAAGQWRKGTWEVAKSYYRKRTCAGREMQVIGKEKYV